MNNKNIDIVVDKLKEYCSGEEMAALAVALTNNFIDIYDIFPYIDSYEKLKETDIEYDDIDFNVYDNEISTPEFLDNTDCYLISVTNSAVRKKEYIVSRYEDEIEQAAKNNIIDYGKEFGIGDFDVDIADYIEYDYLYDWYRKQLREEAKEMYEDLSNKFSNYLIEYLYNEDLLDDYDFSYDRDTGEVDYHDCLVDGYELLEDIYVEDIIANTSNEQVIDLYISEEGKDTFLNNVGTEIEVNWDSLANECIKIDGVESYLSTDNTMTEIDINGNTYYVFLYAEKS